MNQKGNEAEVVAKLTGRILSGVQPSGKLHIGNYFGAIKQHIELQENGDAFYFIADYHAMTTLREAAEKERAEAEKCGQQARDPATILAENVRDVALDYLALGLDPERAVFYKQSDIPEVNELAWILSTVTGMGLLERAHSYKDKVAKGISPSVGLFTYPILMAADILIVRSHHVPVGKDQVQHLEMTRDMAGYFNQIFRDVFPMPQEHLAAVPVVPGTDGQKMSKSYNNAIDIFATDKQLKKTVMSIVTDSTPVDDPKSPEDCNVFALLKLFASAEELNRIADQYRQPMLFAEERDGKPFGYGHAKKFLLEKIQNYFAAAKAKRAELVNQPEYVERVLADGARRARAVVSETMHQVRQAVGLI